MVDGSDGTGDDGDGERVVGGSDGTGDDGDALNGDGDGVVRGSDGSEDDDDDDDNLSDSGENIVPKNLSLARVEDVFSKYTPASGVS